jgi:hypothetical protein
MLPNGRSFTLLAHWWTESGMEGFKPRSASYPFEASPDILLVALDVIVPMKMEGRLHLGHGGFGPPRMMNVLRGIASGAGLPPIEITDIGERHHGSYRYVIGGMGGGVHRFYASVAAGFSDIPVVLRWLPEHVIDELVTHIDS